LCEPGTFAIIAAPRRAAASAAAPGEHAMSSIDPLPDLDLLIWLVIGAGLAVLWLLLILLPFAVFGTKRRLDRLSAQLGEIHEELRRLNERSMSPFEAPLRATPPEPQGGGEPRMRLRVDQDDRVR
jgi:hypothetical protein